MTKVFLQFWYSMVVSISLNIFLLRLFNFSPYRMSLNIQDSDVGRSYGTIFSGKNNNNNKKTPKGWLRVNYTSGRKPHQEGRGGWDTSLHKSHTWPCTWPTSRENAEPSAFPWEQRVWTPPWAPHLVRPAPQRWTRKTWSFES